METLQREWAAFPAESAKVSEQATPKRRSRRTPRTPEAVERAEVSKQATPKKRLKRGLCTPQDAFRRPILEALIELGGSAHIGDVEKIVGAKMQSLLNQYDHELVRSGSVRWKTSARFCRSTLVQEGLMKSDSPYGLWEISDKGREWLKKTRDEDQLVNRPVAT